MQNNFSADDDILKMYLTVLIQWLRDFMGRNNNAREQTGQ